MQIDGWMMGGLIAVLVGVLFWDATPARAQGVVLGPGQRPLPLVRQKVDTVIDHQAATTTVDQTFRNPTGQPLEGTFLFPLPEGAAVSDFAMTVNGEKVQAELLAADKAREIYESIVRQLKDPGLLEYVGRSLFRARIFPIAPQERKTITLEYTQAIEVSDGLAKYVLPLKTQGFWGRVSPVIFDPPRPGPQPRGPRDGVTRVPRPAPESPLPERIENLAVRVSVSAPADITSVYSPSHEVDLQRDGNRRVTVGFEATQVVPDEDFVLYWQQSDAMFGLNIMTNRENPNEDGYFMILLAPRSSLREQEIQAKDIVFVFDVSGSMSGDKIRQAQEALAYCLDNLNPEDRFNVLSFSTGVSAYQDQLVPASPANRAAAREFVAGLRARGGTNIEGALRDGLSQFKSTDRPAMMLFLTDGQPTVGESDELALLRQAAQQAPEGVRIFAFGVGDDVNTLLLDRLSTDHGGTRTYVRPHENLEVAVSNLYGKIASPVLSNLRLSVSGVTLSELNPDRLPDLFRGSQITLLGRYSGHGPARVVLRGEAGGAEEVFEYSADFAASGRSHSFIPRLWATRQIGMLLEQIRLHGQNKELVDEVVWLATRHGILTPYTSYLVLEPGMSANSAAGTALRDRRVARQAPGGGADGPSGPLPDVYAAPAPSEARVGAGAVERSQGEESLRSASRVRQSANLELRQVGTRTFYAIEEAWVDSLWPEIPGDRRIVALQYGSPAWEELLNLRPDLLECLALGQVVKIAAGDLLLSIGTDGATALSAADRALLAP